jgi:hypothetical protein
VRKIANVIIETSKIRAETPHRKTISEVLNPRQDKPDDIGPRRQHRRPGDAFREEDRQSGDVLCFDITSVSTNSRLNGWGKWGHNRDGEKMLQMNIGLITDKRGGPVDAYQYIPEAYLQN